MKRTAIVGLLSLAVLSGCSTSKSAPVTVTAAPLTVTVQPAITEPTVAPATAAAEDVSTSAVASTAAPTASSTSGAQPTVSAAPMAIGKWQFITADLAATVLSWHRGDGAGEAELRVCASANAPITKISSDQWELRGASDGGFPVDPMQSSIIKTSPYFDANGDRMVYTGKCADGWVSFHMPAAFVPVHITFTSAPQSSGDPDLSWNLDG